MREESRPSRLLTLMSTAHLWAERSTCSRLHVGCVLHRDGRILVQGYNGAPAGLSHCDHECSCVLTDHGEHYPDCNSGPQNCRAVHAEQNAIAWAARWGVGLENAEAVITHQPCLACARLLINAGLIQVTFQEPYRLQDGVNLLIEAGIPVYQLVLDQGDTEKIRLHG